MFIRFILKELLVGELSAMFESEIVLGVGLYNSIHSSLLVVADDPVPAHAISLITTGRNHTSTEIMCATLSLPVVSIAVALKTYVVLSVGAIYIVEAVVVLAKEKPLHAVPFAVHSIL